MTRLRRTLIAVCGAGVVAGTGLTLARQDVREENGVFEAVFRQQLDALRSLDGGRVGPVVCLGIDPGDAPQSPGDELMRRFADRPGVRALARCEVREKRTVELGPEVAAVLLVAGPIEWIAEDEAWVRVREVRSRSSSFVRRYRVVRESSGWVCLGPILNGGPA